MAQGNPAENFMALTSLNRQFIATLTRPTAGGRNEPTNIPKAGYISALAMDVRGTIGTGVATAPTLDPGHAGIINRIFLNTNVVGRLIDISGFAYHHMYRPYMDSGYFDGLANVIGFDADIAIATGAFRAPYLFPLGLNPLSTRGLFMNQSERRNVTLTLEWATQAQLDVNATPTLAFTGSPTCDIWWEFYDAPEGADNQPDQTEVHTITEYEQIQSAAGTVTYEPERSGWYLRLLMGYNSEVGLTADQFDALNVRINQTLHPYDMTNDGWEIFHHRYHPTRKVGTVLLDLAAYSGLGMFGVGRDWFPSFSYPNFALLFTVGASGTLRAVIDQLYRRVAATA